MTVSTVDDRIRIALAARQGVVHEFEKAMFAKMADALRKDPGRSPVPWLDYSTPYLRWRKHQEHKEWQEAVGQAYGPIFQPALSDDFSQEFDSDRLSFIDAEIGEILDDSNFGLFLWKKRMETREALIASGAGRN